MEFINNLFVELPAINKLFRSFCRFDLRIADIGYVTAQIFQNFNEKTKLSISEYEAEPSYGAC